MMRSRHCERSDEAIQLGREQPWIASLAMTMRMADALKSRK
jgi:hypothetical protein